MFHENKIFRVKYLISKFPYSAQMQKKTNQKNSEYGYYLCNV